MTTRTTISLPDDLAEQIQAEGDTLNVSGLCQRALRAELHRRAAVAQLDKGMKREVFTIDDGEGMTSVAFTGQLIAAGRDGRNDAEVYLTRQHRIAIYNEDNQTLSDFDGLDDAEEAGHDPLLLARAASALSDERVVELDI